jgi:murein DD-endopeptidase MepM/ murein hydrolase activator NlpD
MFCGVSISHVEFSHPAMKNIATVTFAIFLALGFCAFAQVTAAQSSSFAAKLPYEKGESFVVTQGYHSPPTHVNKDDFAIDFTQNGCDAYAKPAVAAVSGKAWIVQESGYNGGYGTELLVLSDGNVVTRYAHLISDSIAVVAGDEIAQGMPIGEIGNSGLVMGTACALHPGTHIHFAMDTENADGNFTAKDPEPISGSANIVEGKWYLSDNALSADASKSSGLTAIVAQNIGGTADDVGVSAHGVSQNDAAASPPDDTESDAPSSFSASAVSSSLFGAISKTSSSDDAFDDVSSAEGQLASSSGSVPLASSTENVTSVTAASSSATQPIAPSFGGGSGSIGASSAPPIGGVMVLPSQPAIQNSSPIAARSASGDPSSSMEISLGAASSSSENSAQDFASASSSSEEAATSSQENAVSSSIAPIGDASSSVSAATSSPQFILDAPIAPPDAGPIASFNSSTLAVDLSWQSPQNASGSGPTVYNIFLASAGAGNSSSTLIASTTANSFSYAIPDADFGGSDAFAVQATDGAGDQSALATTTVFLPDWYSAIQPIDSDDSRPSWYNDNWYDLGTGFHGTIRSLTLEGFINSDLYGGSTVALQEFSDADYAVLEHTFPISPAPFTQMTAKIKIGGLKIPLLPDKYYRLTTVQSYQNRSVILKGTDATGTAMWDNYVYGVGGVQYQYAFYPYLSAIIDSQEIVIAPPSLLGDISVAFDAANSKINVSWPAATDADEPLVPPTYQVNISTSTTLDSAGWQSEGTNLSASFDVTFPNAYTIGIRALDDFGQPSSPIVASWNFPVGYAPMPSQLDHSTMFSYGGGAQKITFAATTTVSAIDFWTAPTSGMFCCSQTYLSVYNDNAGSRGTEIPSGNPVVTYGPYDGGGEVSYPFSAPIAFSPGSYWFAITVGPSGTTNPTILYGSPGGIAFFRIVQVSGP